MADDKKDFAKVGFGVQVNGFEKIENSLNSVASGISRMEKIMKVACAAMGQSNLLLAKSTEGAVAAEIEHAEKIYETSRALYLEKKAAEQVTQTYNQQTRVLQKLNTESARQQQPTSDYSLRTAAQANRFNTGNIAAQFQDIAVTSAMNMNPLTIGLQQGTQLVYILQQSKAPLADFAAGLKNLVSPLTFVTVGITALVAAGIQMIDWTSLAQGALNTLASILDAAGVVVEKYKSVLIALGAVYVYLNKTAIANAILAVESFIAAQGAAALAAIKDGAKIAAGWLAALGPIGLVSAAILGLAAGVIYLTGGEEAVDNFFTKMANKVREFGDSLNETNSVFDEFDKKIEKLEFERSLIGLDDYTKAFKEAQRDLQQTLSNKKAELIAKGASDKEISKLEKQISLIDENAKKIANLVVSIDKEKEAYRNGQKAIEDYDRALKNLSDSYDNLALSYQTKIEDLNFKNSLKNMSDEEKIVARINNEYEKQIEILERKAAKDNIDISKFQEKINNIEKQKNAFIDLELQTYKNEEAQKAWNSALDYSSSLTKSFFSNLKSGLQEGQSAWEAFTNAVLKMLDKIADKMMDLAIDAAFDSLKQGGTGKSNNLMSSIVDWTSTAVMSAFGYENMGGIKGSVNPASAEFASTVGIKPAIPAAQGGVFSNGIYSSPTMFKFAKGGKFGVMGEAGPEAVMPLHRSPDGSLGVRADGMGGSSPVVVNVINNSNARATTQQRQTEQGTTIDVMIDELVAQKLGQQGTASNQALTAFNNRQLVAR